MQRDRDSFSGVYEKNVGGHKFVIALRGDGTLVERKLDSIDTWEGTWEEKRGKLHLRIGDYHSILSLKKHFDADRFEGKENGQDDIKLIAKHFFPARWFAGPWKKTTYERYPSDEKGNLQIPSPVLRGSVFHDECLLNDQRHFAIDLKPDYTLVEREYGEGTGEWGGSWEMDDLGIVTIYIGDYTNKLLLRENGQYNYSEQRLDGFEFYEGEPRLSVVYKRDWIS